MWRGPARRRAVAGGVHPSQDIQERGGGARAAAKKGNRETLSTVMLDYDYNGDVFDLDTVFFADAIEKAGWEIRFPVESVGGQVMAVFIDIYGNEAREVIPGERMGMDATTDKTASKRGKKGKGSE